MKKILFLILALMPIAAVQAQSSLPATVRMRGVPSADGKSTYYYATYFNGTENFLMPAAVSAYIVKYDGADWTFNSGYDSNAVKNGEPVVLYTTSDDIAKAQDQSEYSIADGVLTITLKAVTDQQTINKLNNMSTQKEQDSNDLCGTDEATDLTQDADANDYYYYALQTHHQDGQCTDAGGNVNQKCPHMGFFWMNDNGAPFTNGAHKSYLRVQKTTVSPARCQGFNLFDAKRGDETGIEMVSGGFNWFQMVPDGSNGFQMVPDGSRYNIQGRRTGGAAAGKGLYIRNGKKYIAR